MIVSLYLWGGAQRAERCRWCLSCSQCRHYKPDWFYVGLWTEPFASERPRNWFLQNIIFSRMGSKCFPPLINCRHRRGIEFPLVARLVSVYVERSDDGHLGSAGDCRWGELCWSFTVYEYSSETFRSGCVLSRFALSWGARRQQTSVSSSELPAASWTSDAAELRESNTSTLPGHRCGDTDGFQLYLVTSNYSVSIICTGPE